MGGMGGSDIVLLVYVHDIDTPYAFYFYYMDSWNEKYIGNLIIYIYIYTSRIQKRIMLYKTAKASTSGISTPPQK